MEQCTLKTSHATRLSERYVHQRTLVKQLWKLLLIDYSVKFHMHMHTERKLNTEQTDIDKNEKLGKV